MKFSNACIENTERDNNHQRQHAITEAKPLINCVAHFLCLLTLGAHLVVLHQAAQLHERLFSFAA
jgi:hypothetical protein